MVDHFVEVHRQPDGKVWPRPDVSTGDHARHDAAAHATASSAPAVEPIDVYLMAYQWGFTPAALRLDLNARYRFHMMAVDVTHGAAIRIGAGSRITRLRTGALVEQELQFRLPGEYLVYCTVYCGMLHDRMRGTILVA
jgi:heme/copper-type cytochrome/quinol oxidase subunit 2